MLELRIRLMEDAQQKVDSIKEKTQSKIDELRAELAASESQRGILQQKFGLIKAVLDDPNGGDDSSTLNFIRLVAQL
ncbi:hypothetical protein LPJ61_001077 [Coemansia biformis]|uniref:Uncharacterized protein n=1 Tax=Coemansia biformis TaxID=1286918 RepID=A0A9W7YAP0_9FUNG|nr:hypothetical protein LPJ61_001077 [Coemansia biformis]